MNEYFNYDAPSGVIRWKRRPPEHFKSGRGCNIFNAVFSGKDAGCLCGHGYLSVGISMFGKSAKLFLVHRIIWEMHHGPIPHGMEIDHIDGNKLNNRIENLRLATRAQNTMNSGPRITNRSGKKGVRIDRRNPHRPWFAQIAKGGRVYHLGYFATADEAAEAYSKQANILHGHFSRTTK